MFFIGSAWLQQRRAISGVFDVNWCSFVVVIIKSQSIVVGLNFVGRSITGGGYCAVNGEINCYDVISIITVNIIVCNVKRVGIYFFALWKFIGVDFQPSQVGGVAIVAVDVRLRGVIVVNHYRARTLAEVWLKRAHCR